MDDIFGEMECKYRLDSIMMSLVRYAMDNAHKRMQSKDGPIEFLHERSKFYELAIIQIEGSLKFIQEEADNRVPESSREKMLTDFMDLRHLLRGRLKEMKICIIQKDKELLERLENELKLRHALELKEKEVHSLRSMFEVDKTKGESIQEFVSSEEGNIADEGIDENFGELKNSVDQQVLNIKQRLESKENELYSEMKSMDDWLGVEEKSSDIDVIKGTLELAFGRMQNSEVRPLEKKWRWSIEEDIISILIKGFICNLEQNFVLGKRERDNGNTFGVGLTKDDCLEMIDGMITLRGELEAVWCRNVVEEKKIKGNTEIQEKDSTDGNLQQMRRTSSEPIPLMDYDAREEDLEDNCKGNYVAKMVKSHESIIRKQRDEINWLNLKEALTKKDEDLCAKREKELDGLEKKVQELIAKLENVNKWKDKLCSKECIHENYQENTSNGHDTILKTDIKCLKQKKDDSYLVSFALEEHYIVLLKGLLNDFYLEFNKYDIERSIWEDIFVHYFSEMIKEWNLTFLSRCMELEIREEIYCVFLSDQAQKDSFSKHGVPSLNNQSGIKEENNLESILREDLHAVFLREMVKEWNNSIQSNIKSTASTGLGEITIESILKEDVYLVFLREIDEVWKMEQYALELENIFREDIYQLVIIEAVKDAAYNRHYLSGDLHYPMKLDELSEDTAGESLIQELDNLLEFFEVEEDLTERESPEVKKPRVHNIRTLNWLMNEEEKCFSPVSDKLEKALEQLGATKELLKELEDQINPNIYFFQGKRAVDLTCFDYALIPLIEFQLVLTNFENTVQDLLKNNSLRLEIVKQEINNLFQLGDSLRKKELLYKKAFLRRCHNLRLAEIEVDLLGDQVDVLAGLLGKIYLILDQYSPQLSKYFDVLNMLKQIEKDVPIDHK